MEPKLAGGTGRRDGGMGPQSTVVGLGRGRTVKRGDIVTVMTVLPLTSDVRRLPLLRVAVEPGEETGLRLLSEIQVDKIMTVPRDEIGPRLGALDEDTIQRVDEARLRFLGLGWRMPEVE
jgi:mRNA-degrading endonuclease toxin of MazEF toxin-antitoxin module